MKAKKLPDGQTLVGGVGDLAKQGQIEAALAAFAAAQDPEADIELPFTTLNSLCWFGSLDGYAAELLTDIFRYYELKIFFLKTIIAKLVILTYTALKMN